MRQKPHERLRHALMALAAGGLSLAFVPGVAAATPEAFPHAGSADPGPPVRVSGPSPFADCPPADPDARLPGGAFEPQVAVNPTDADNVVAVWAQDSFRGLVVGTSFDGGATWQREVVPGLTRCTGGEFDYVDDSWLSFGPDGVAHLYAKVFDVGENPSGAYALRSTDGGRTWSSSVPLVMETNPKRGNYSSGAISADPNDAGHVYAVVPKFSEPGDPAKPYRGAVYFTRSRDGGQTWRPARKILDPGKDRMVTSPQVVVSPDGTLIGAFTLIDFRDDPRRPALRVAVIRSTNQGRSWSRPRVVAELGTRGTSDPRTGDAVAGSSRLLTDAAVDPATGRVYLAWQDARPNGGKADAIALSSSADGGRTWTSPVRVNDTPTGVPVGDQQAFTPSVAVAADGTVAVGYYDFRNNDTGTALWTDRYLVFCDPTPTAPCTRSDAFGDEVRLTETSFDMRKTSFVEATRSFDLSGYVGLAATGRGFLAAFPVTHGDDPGRVLARRVTVRSVHGGAARTGDAPHRTPGDRPPAYPEHATHSGGRS